MGSNVKNMEAGSGRLLKEDSVPVNIADLAELSHDNHSGAVIEISRDHAKIHEGLAFVTCHEFVMTADAPLYCHFTTGEMAVHLKNRDLETNNTNTVFEIWKDQTVVPNGTPELLLPRKSNLLSDLVSGCVFRLNSVVTIDEAPEKVVCRMKVYGAELVGVRVQGGPAAADWEIILKPNTDYVIRVHRPGETGTGKLRMELRWYEDLTNDAT